MLPGCRLDGRGLQAVIRLAAPSEPQGPPPSSPPMGATSATVPAARRPSVLAQRAPRRAGAVAYSLAAHHRRRPGALTATAWNPLGAPPNPARLEAPCAMTPSAMKVDPGRAARGPMPRAAAPVPLRPPAATARREVHARPLLAATTEPAVAAWRRRFRLVTAPCGPSRERTVACRES